MADLGKGSPCVPDDGFNWIVFFEHMVAPILGLTFHSRTHVPANRRRMAHRHAMG